MTSKMFFALSVTFFLAAPPVAFSEAPPGGPGGPGGDITHLQECQFSESLCLVGCDIAHIADPVGNAACRVQCGEQCAVCAETYLLPLSEACLGH